MSSGRFLKAFYGVGTSTTTYFNIIGSSTGDGNSGYGAITGEHTYEINITQLSSSSWNFEIIYDETETLYNNSVTLSIENSDIVVSVGQRINKNGVAVDQTQMEILEFSVTKELSS